MVGTTTGKVLVLTAEQEEFLRTVPDDREEAPWMVMSDPQFWSASTFALSLRAYAERRGLPWYVAGMLPILYPRPGRRRKGQVAPDVLVAFVPVRARDSYDLQQEGVFPAFVLEVISPSSVTHDVDVKRRTYEILGAEEYVLFDPPATDWRAALRGFRRPHLGAAFIEWTADPRGQLWSDVLGLFLAAEGGDLRAILPDGTRLPTYAESEVARLRAEEDVARLRAELGATARGSLNAHVF